MMIYSSNNTEHLCRKLAENTGKALTVFDREIIITQSAGMTSWLKVNLAKQKGVIANVVFMNQDSLLGEIHLLLFGERPVINKDFTRFRIYGLLGKDEFRSAFPAVAAYCENNDLHRIQLAGRISDLFDQYQLYRPEMVDLWGGGHLRDNAPAAEKWQQWLWEKMNIGSRMDLRNELIAEMKTRREEIAKSFPRISLFGITVFTQFHLEFFRELSEITRVDLYLCLPSGQDEFKNELLISFGSKAKELAGLVSENFGSPASFEKISSDGKSTLAELQKHILDNKNDIKIADDGSITVNSCHTPVREVECMYNYLIDLFEKDRKKEHAQSQEGTGHFENLKPSDILVVVPDIDNYAPVIKAVFSFAPVKIPIWISGASCSTEDTISSTVEKILKFTWDDFTSEKVVSLLEQKRISSRFGITDCDHIRSVVRKANIRFGKENSTEDDSIFVSWKYGLEKIILGYAINTDKEILPPGGLSLFPYRDAEASASFDLLRLKDFTDKLGSVIDEQSVSRTVAEWKEFLIKVIEELVYHDDFDKEDRADLNSVYRAMSYIDNIDFQGKVPFSVFLEELEVKLFSESREIRLGTGNVTVSSPVSVRGIPFKVICFLGLNNDAFPGKDRFSGFDLLGADYRPGDRSKRETDKYLFLDLMLSARENLYLSYIGRNVKDNSEIPPSILVDTLVNYLGEQVKITEHPLHGFSSVYSDPSDRKKFTYLYGEKSDDYTFKVKEKTEIQEVTLKKFIDFYKDPLEWYFNYILDIKYDRPEDILDETELFELDSLQKWNLRKKLLVTKSEDIEQWIEECKKEGLLPLKTSAIVEVKQLMEEMEFLIPAFTNASGNLPEASYVIDLVIDNVKFSGTAEGIYGKKFIAYSVSDHPLKYKAEAYIKALLLTASGIIDSAIFIDKQGIETAIPVSKATAAAEISRLLEFFLKSQSAPRLITMRIADSAIDAYKDGREDPDGKKLRKILEKINKEVLPDEYQNTPNNPYLQILTWEKFLEGFGEENINEILEFAEILKLSEF